MLVLVGVIYVVVLARFVVVHDGIGVGVGVCAGLGAFVVVLDGIGVHGLGRSSLYLMASESALMCVLLLVRSSWYLMASALAFMVWAHSLWYLTASALAFVVLAGSPLYLIDGAGIRGLGPVVVVLDYLMASESVLVFMLSWSVRRCT